MLTTEGSQNRKWGHFPALRQVLQEKQIPSQYYGPTSVSDNLFNYLNRLVEIAVVVREHERQIIEAVNSENVKQLCEDLHKLEEELEFGRRFYSEHASMLRNLGNEVHECHELRLKENAKADSGK